MTTQRVFAAINNDDELYLDAHTTVHRQDPYGPVDQSVIDDLATLVESFAEDHDIDIGHVRWGDLITMLQQTEPATIRSAS